jgi:glyoxylase-like metal-dependent hydrolase (beta-lactamase superfamily II)
MEGGGVSMPEGLRSARHGAGSDGMRVYILDIGHMECDANLVVAGTVVGNRATPNPVLQWTKIPTYAVLIDHPERTVLFDLGVHPDHIHPPEVRDVFPYYCREEQRIEKQLALAGFEPKDVDTVILSHLHFDHCGSLPLFEHADIYFNPAELRANPHIPPALSIKKAHFIEKDGEILRGVDAITLPGHSAGLLGIVVHLKEEGALIFTSDALYSRRNYGPPARPSGTVYDTLSYYESIEKVRRLETFCSARIMFSHDIEFFETMKKAPEYYK